MITDFDQAKAIQTRRATAGKRGYAKAVRRYIGKGSMDYRRAIDALPVSWQPKAEAKVVPPRGRAVLPSGVSL